MMKKIKVLALTCMVLFTVTSCFEDLDDNAIAVSEINDFVWKGMNVFYVYKDNIDDLINRSFADADYGDYLNSFSSPEDLFNSLLYLPDDVDEFSLITPNYFDLQNQLQGTTLSNGMAFGLHALPSEEEAIFGYVRYIMPNTSAESVGLTRGIVFNSVDGTLLTRSNYTSLLFGSNTTYTIDLATYDDNGTPSDFDDDTVTSTNGSFTLTKAAYTENPILRHDVLNVQGSTIGYLMYNGFRIGDTNLTELNTVFAEFNSAGISDLVLDLRYNGGGSVSTAIWLASMITGQLTGETFFKEEWNNEIQALLEQNDPQSLINPFVNEIVKRNSNGDVTFQQPINSLNLNKVYILTSGSTASASELVINGLDPHIDVVQIGKNTRGKPQASTTIYDSENFAFQNVNPNHTYALQPLIYEASNSAGVSDYYDGLEPDLGFALSENYANLSQLGSVNEPLLARAILDITGVGRSFSTPTNSLEEIANDKSESIFSNQMFDDL